MKISVAGVIVGFIIGVFLAKSGRDCYWQNVASDLGHAEYYIDANYEKQWRWKTNCLQGIKP